VFGIGIILFGKIIFAQQVDQLTRMRIAESYTDAGDWEHALPIYESLYKEQPDNYIFFDKLRTCYVQLKKYENAIRITERRLSAQPKDGYLMTQLGGLYYRKGDERKADSLWMLVLKMEPKNANSFRMVAMEMYEHRLYERAIIVYKEARKALNNPALFADDLAGLFAALQQYGNATKEFVQIIRANPQQLIYIQSRFSQFTQKEGGLKEAISVVRQEVETNPNDITVRQLLGWLYMEGKNFEAALDEYTVIEKLSKSGGNELFNFGKRAFQEKQYLIAERTFKRITEGFVASNVYPFARFERARAIEERAGETDSSSRSAFIQEGIEAATYQY
jgi:tetratricopeptide (TPR) repeat protein